MLKNIIKFFKDSKELYWFETFSYELLNSSKLITKGTLNLFLNYLITEFYNLFNRSFLSMFSETDDRNLMN